MNTKPKMSNKKIVKKSLIGKFHPEKVKKSIALDNFKHSVKKEKKRGSKKGNKATIYKEMMELLYPNGAPSIINNLRKPFQSYFTVKQIRDVCTVLRNPEKNALNTFTDITISPRRIKTGVHYLNITSKKNFQDYINCKIDLDDISVGRKKAQLSEMSKMQLHKKCKTYNNYNQKWKQPKANMMNFLLKRWTEQVGGGQFIINVIQENSYTDLGFVKFPSWEYRVSINSNDGEYVVKQSTPDDILLEIYDKLLSKFRDEADIEDSEKVLYILDGRTGKGDVITIKEGITFAKNITAEVLTERIKDVLTSSESIDFNSSRHIFKGYPIAKGRGKRSNYIPVININDFGRESGKNKSAVYFECESHCFAYAVWFATKYKEMLKNEEEKKYWKTMKKFKGYNTNKKSEELRDWHQRECKQWWKNRGVDDWENLHTVEITDAKLLPLQTKVGKNIVILNIGVEGSGICKAWASEVYLDDVSDEDGTNTRQLPTENNTIFIIYTDNHFLPVIKLKNLYKTPCEKHTPSNPFTYCFKCYTFHNTRDTNRCDGVSTKKTYCLKCNHNHFKAPKLKPTKIECKDCHIIFYYDECYEYHKKQRMRKMKGKTIFEECRCETDFLCTKPHPFQPGDLCYEEVRNNTVERKLKGRGHKCGFKYCKSCDKQVKLEHQCYVRPLTLTDLKNKCPPEQIVYFDLETFAINTHKPYLCCALLVDYVYTCSENEIDLESGYIEYEYDNSYIYARRITKFHHWGFDCVQKFMSWLINLTSNKKGLTVMAHNSKGYDAQFIKQELIKQSCTNEPWDEIDTGNKILQLRFGKKRIRIIDSLSHIPAPLKKFKDIFGIDDCKTYFPHLFACESNFTYVGNVPDKKFYGYDEMSKKGKIEFDDWFNKHKKQYHKNWNFKEICIDYCFMDCQVLCDGVDVLRTSYYNSFVEKAKNLEKSKLLEEPLLTTNTNYFVPDFTKYPTLAGYSNSIYRLFFLKDHMVAQIGEEKEKYGSLPEAEWIAYMSHKNNIDIERQKEVLLTYGNPKVRHRCHLDGYSSKNGDKVAYEFLGCYWHRCKQCFNHYSVKDKNIYNNTIERIKALKSKGYKVIQIWEHQWQKMKKENDDVKLFLLTNKHRIFHPYFSYRKSYTGGRTEVFKHYVKCKDDNCLLYLDFTSLFPSTQALHEFPVGHPVIIPDRKNRKIEKLILPTFEDDILKNVYRGFVKVFLIPSNIHIPITPNKTDKLYFNTKPYVADITTEELKLAIKHGYKVKEVYEIVHWENWSNDIFRESVKYIYKSKAENSVKFNSSENPEDVKMKVYNENLRLVKPFADLYEGVSGNKPDLHFNVELDLEKMTYNSGMRLCNKLLANASYGRWALKYCIPRTKIVNNAKDYNEMIMDNKIDLLPTTAYYSGNKSGTVEFKYKDRNAKETFAHNTNVALASYITSYSRIWLYTLFERVGFENVAYADSDSCVFKVKLDKTTNRPIIPESIKHHINSCLGGLTDELEGNHFDTWITEFVALAPKSYAYKTNKNKVCVKAKGFQLAGICEEVVSMENMKKTLKSYLDKCYNEGVDIAEKEGVYMKYDKDEKIEIPCKTRFSVNRFDYKKDEQGEYLYEKDVSGNYKLDKKGKKIKVRNYSLNDFNVETEKITKKFGFGKHFKRQLVIPKDYSPDQELPNEINTVPF